MNTPLLLLIETASHICSCALAFGKDIVAYQESTIPNAHSQRLIPMIDNLFSQSYYGISQLSAVAVSKGPGSYTGLRIGTSTAKGLCYGLNVPLIAVDTLSILALSAKENVLMGSVNAQTTFYLPMLDAHRMEVYSAIYDRNLKIVKPVSADIIEPNVYDNYLKESLQMIICGDGVAKCRDILKDNKYVFVDGISLSAKYMVETALSKFISQQYEGTAYFEPYYLKDFVASKSIVKGLYC